MGKIKCVYWNAIALWVVLYEKENIIPSLCKNMKLWAILIALCLITLFLPLCSETIEAKDRIKEHRVIGAYGSEDEGAAVILEGYYDTENRHLHVGPWGSGSVNTSVEVMDVIFSDSFKYMSVCLSKGKIGNGGQISFTPVKSFIAQWKENNTWVSDEFNPWINVTIESNATLVFDITMSLIEVRWIEEGMVGGPTYLEIVPGLIREEAPGLYDLVHDYTIKTPGWYKEWRETHL